MTLLQTGTMVNWLSPNFAHLKLNAGTIYFRQIEVWLMEKWTIQLFSFLERKKKKSPVIVWWNYKIEHINFYVEDYLNYQREFGPADWLNFHNKYVFTFSLR
jgi:hypothetical protein